MKLESISPSSLNRFYNCPLNWYFHHIGKRGVAVEEKARMLGKAIHNIIAIYYQKISDRPTPDEIDLKIKEAFEEGDTFALKGFKAKTQRMLENFANFEKKRLRTWKAYKPTFVEKRFEVQLWQDVPPIRVVVDFYGREDETLIDWKTGINDISESNLRQGKIYELVLKRLGYPVRRVIFFGLDRGTNLTVPRVTEGWIYKLVRFMVDSVENENFRPKPGPLCEYCEYKLDCQLREECLWRTL